MNTVGFGFDSAKIPMIGGLQDITVTKEMGRD